MIQHGLLVEISDIEGNTRNPNMGSLLKYQTPKGIPETDPLASGPKSMTKVQELQESSRSIQYRIERSIPYSGPLTWLSRVTTSLTVSIRNCLIRLSFHFDFNEMQLTNLPQMYLTSLPQRASFYSQG